MTTVGSLSTYFTSILSDIMLSERQPLARLQQQRDSFNTRSAAYSEVDTRLNSLLSAVKALRTNSISPALTAGRSAAISNVPSGYSVLGASASSSAIAGIYNIAVTRLASEQRVRSDQQTYADQALNLSGTFRVGGAAARSTSGESAITGTVTDLDTASLASGQVELGSGNYFVETRQDASLGWQFRLVDAEGKSASIRQGTSTTYAAGWQAIPTGGGVYDSGRGLTITFGTDSQQYHSAGKGAGAAQVTYAAKGAAIDIVATDSLNNIAAKINNATYPQGDGVSASVVDRQLVLAAKTSGTAHSILAGDTSGTVLQTLGVLTGVGGFKNVLQSAQDAVFSVNGQVVTRGQNTNLSDVISGVTLNLQPDAETKSATLTVNADWSSARNAIDTFVTKYNDALAYLEKQTAVVQTSGGESPTYSRGPLSGDTVFGELRRNLLSTFSSNFTNGGAYDSLRQIGLQIGNNLRASVTDSDKLEAALKSNPDAVIELVDGVMGKFDTLLSRFTGGSGKTGYLDSAITSFSGQIAGLDSKISTMNTYLSERQEFLTNQFAGVQATLTSMSYTQQMMTSLYGSLNQLY